MAKTGLGRRKKLDGDSRIYKQREDKVVCHILS
jgi:hypothetical protein